MQRVIMFNSLHHLEFGTKSFPPCGRFQIKRLHNANKKMNLSDSPNSLNLRGQASILRKLKATQNIREKNSLYLPV